MKPRRKIAMAIATLSALTLLIGIFVSRGRTVMPLDDETLAKYQEANSRAATKLHEAHPDMAPPVEASLSFRLAVKELGFDPDKTLLHWLSPEFKKELASGDPNELVSKSRLAESMTATALGDGCNDEEFSKILTNYSPAVRQAARIRRSPAP